MSRWARLVAVLAAALTLTGSASAGVPEPLGAADADPVWVSGGRAVAYLHVVRQPPVFKQGPCPVVVPRVVDVRGRRLASLEPFRPCVGDRRVLAWQPGGMRYAIARAGQGPGDEGWVDLGDWRTGAGERIASGALVDALSWSPDGRRLAFQRQDGGEVVTSVLDVATGVVEELGSGAIVAWSRDGGRAVLRTVTREARIVSVDGSGPTIDLPTGMDQLSPDLDAGVVASATTATIVDLADGSTTVLPAIGPIARAPVDPRFALTSRRFALVTSTGGMAVGEVDGRVRTVVAGVAGWDGRHGGTASVHPPAWSPDGSFLGYVDLAGRVVIVRPDGMPIADIGTVPRDDRWTAWWSRPLSGSLAWSPDGRWLVSDAGFGCYPGLKLTGGPGLGLRWLTNDCRIVGTPRDDVLRGTRGPDVIYALGGNDVVVAGGGDVVFGGRGNDRITGGDGDDQLFGEEGDDVLLDARGIDHLVGGPGDDTLVDRYWRDVLEGGPGDDVIRARDDARDVVDGGPGTDAASVDGPRFGGRDVLRGIERRLAEALA